jgi:hypothetical protein
VEIIGEWAFLPRTSLGDFTFTSPGNLRYIDKFAFVGCGSLKSICFPASVRVLDRKSFSLCKSLESVTFASGSELLEIEDEAFTGCALRSLCIPTAVEAIGQNYFTGCELMTSLTFAKRSKLRFLFSIPCFHRSSIGFPDSVEVLTLPITGTSDRGIIL